VGGVSAGSDAGYGLSRRSRKLQVPSAASLSRRRGAAGGVVNRGEGVALLSFYQPDVVRLQCFEYGVGESRQPYMTFPVAPQVEDQLEIAANVAAASMPLAT
jgi:hypothetical protein